MRTENSIKNILWGISSQIIIVLLGFITRKIFIDNLSAEYLGINGVLTNVLSMLGLVESGIGVSIVYHLYKPLADRNQREITALVQLYKKLYLFIAIGVFILSLSLYPFLNIIIKDGSSIKYLNIVYFIFVLRNIVSYLNAHKWSLINADQKGYILKKYNLLFYIFTTVSKIIILLVTQNYVLYLLVDLIIFLIQTYINGNIVNRMYPYLTEKQIFKVDPELKKEISINVKALFLHNIGSFIVFGTDNLLISSLISVATVGIYSNYTMILSQMTALLNPMLDGIGASIGNLIATESKDKNYSVFNIIYLINFWIYSLSVIFLYNLLEPFISWWIGPGYLLDRFTFIIILVNFYLAGMRGSIGAFKGKAGIFEQDKYVSIIEGGINFFASLILVKCFGLVGIFLGTTLSTLMTVFWNVPRLTFKHVFNKPLKAYFIKYIYYVGLTVSVGWLTTSIVSKVDLTSIFIELVIKGIICLIIPNIIYFLIFRKKEEFRYIYDSFIKKFMMTILPKYHKYVSNC